MTRLTNALREEIADKIMRNVPVIDYPAKIKELLNEHARKIAPPEIMALWGTPAWQYVSSDVVYLRNGDGYATVCPLPACGDDRLSPNHSHPAWRSLFDALSESGLSGQASRQIEARKEMKRKLIQAMQQTTTVNGLRKILSPDLHQFVPVVVEQSSNLPIPSVVAELKAMGMIFEEATE
jgi:hypothetical protein